MQREVNMKQIIDEYADMVYRIALTRCRCIENAEDVFQEVFMRFSEKNPNFENSEHEKAWFIRVTVNCCKSFWDRLRKNVYDEIDENIPEEEVPDEVLGEVLDRLPPDYRVVIHLFYYEDMSTSDISKVLEKNESTVRMQLTRARRLLKDFMKGEEINV